MVGVARFELATYCSQSSRASQAALPPEGAAEGVILTRNRFVCKEIYKSPQTIELNAGDVFSAGKGFLKTFICLNDAELISITQLKSETVEEKEYIRLYLDGKPLKSAMA